MMGGITAGFCLREWELWYGDGTKQSPCPIPLSDGMVCGDNTLSGPRCPYNRDCAKPLSVDMTEQKYVTYAYLNDKNAVPRDRSIHKAT